MHAIILAVGQIEVLLLRIPRERNVPSRAGTKCPFVYKPFLNERSIGLEHLDAIISAVAYIEQAIDGKFGAVNRVAELLRGRRVGIVRTQIRVIRFVAVCAPMPFVFPGVRVIHNHAVVAVAVGDINLIGLLVYENFRRSSKILNVVAAFALTGLADLHEKLPGLCEFENHRVIGISNGSAGLLFVLHLLPARATRASSARSRRCADAVAADPDVAFVIDRDSVIGFRPIIALAASTPTRQQVALLVVVQNRRRRRATLRNRWIGRCVQLTLLERPRAMDDPDVVFVVDRHTNGLA